MNVIYFYLLFQSCYRKIFIVCDLCYVSTGQLPAFITYLWNIRKPEIRAYSNNDTAPLEKNSKDAKEEKACWRRWAQKDRLAL